MKKLAGLIFNRKVLVLAGLVAIALLVWLAGPLVAFADVRPLETPRARLLLIALVLGGYGARQLWKLLAARRANAHLLDAMLGKGAAPAATAPAAGAAEVAQLEQRFAQAAEVLKKTRFARPGERAGPLARFTRQWLYELPWYLLVGSPGSGKTTALANSGLQFPLAERMGLGPVGGVGGTRNCDWWFSDDAVLLDTAGRYTTQDSDRAADSAAWNGFLHLLARYRRRRPVNGVLLTLSVPELLESSPARRGAHIAALGARIEELHRELGIRFPLYVLVTKTDLLAGFSEFFAGLSKDERAQVWGASFPYGEQQAPPRADIPGELAALEERLNARLIDRLQQERDLGRRARLYVFPQQFATLCQSLQDFLGELFAPSRYAEPVLLRGVYFTSATQEGTPIDRVMARLGGALQLERPFFSAQSGTGKSYFLSGLLQEVVFKEAGLACVNLRWERRRVLLQWSTMAAAALLAVAALGAWAVSYARNRDYVAAVASARAAAAVALAATRSGGTDLVELLPVLAAVRHVADVPGGGSAMPLSMDFGLYQGDKLQAAARQAYRTLLRDTFLQRLTVRIEQQLRSDARANPELLYEGLKAYLMLHDARHRDPAALKAYIAADWETRLGSNVAPAQRAALEGHLDALLDDTDWSPAVPADAALIETVRDAIAHTPLAQRIYNRQQRQALAADLPEFTIAGAAGPSAALVFTRTSGAPLTRGVAGLYSVDGYHRVFAAASERVTAQLAGEQPWVLGAAAGPELADPAARAGLLDDVRRRYLQDYARRWEDFVGDIALVRATSLQQSIEQARILSTPPSPLPLLLRAIVKEVTLVPPQGDKPPPDKADERTRSARDELLKLFGQDRQASPTAAQEVPEDVVDRRFDALRRLVQAPPGAPAPIDATVGQIKELYVLLTATEAAVRSGNTPPPSDVPNRIRAEGSSMPEPVRSLMLGLSDSGASEAAGAARANLSQALQSGVFEYCNKAIAGRYPFSRGSDRDVTQEDFARLFAPGGVIDDFFQKNLAPFVNTASRPWRFRDMGAASLGVGSGTLQQFQRAQTIREVFFRPGAAVPGVRVELRPLAMDDGVDKLVLDVDGQILEYSHGAQVAKQVQWPGPRGSNQVRLELASSDGPPAVLVAEGPWALFRLLDRARIEVGAQPEQFVATFDVGGHEAQFRVASSSVQNPFRLPELEQFRCPGQL